MSLFDRIREFFVPGSSLRNRPGGVAYINNRIVGMPGSGIEMLVGCYVVTRRVVHGDFWEIEPPQKMLALKNYRDATGRLCYAGDVGLVVNIGDYALTPIPDAKLSKREVQRLYEPGPVKVAARERA